MAGRFETLAATARTSGWRWACSAALARMAPARAARWWRPRIVSEDALAGQAAAILRAWGMADADADVTVRRMLYADLRGIDSHGCSMLATYDRWRASGALNPRAAVTVVRETAGTALLDAGGGLGHVPATKAMSLAVEKCRAHGAAVVAVRNSGHFGAAGAYAAMAADQGLVGIVTTGTPTTVVVPTFGAEPRLGTNPIAIAAPAGTRRPFLLDMATSAVSLGQLFERWRRGSGIPDGLALDEQGRPMADAGAAIRSGRLAPLGGDRDRGGHKGYGLAASVEILSDILSGTFAGRERNGRPGRVGHFVMAIDPDAFRPAGEFERDVNELVDILHETPPAHRAQPVLVAGDPEADTLTARRASGIPLPRPVFEELRRVARGAGVPFTLDSGGS